ncbi:DUF4132 domain-containing protein [Streptomyces sp. NBC_00059]|uniref:DUF4132 domain-containing protein n=1 Tax=Streptomyces sp. NBC_00059 TaxID=2975635 RepID=UPI0022523E26|nr:DUF4132 domain-containing protein [Streptomyces sp. NBC_00059]MCX5415390.1 DUF4132 domain-containing protein [Streptomyces sp. NBC_00059]
MRRWEFVEGSASKFWETGAEGTVVTVRYGRCGSDGRTQSKEYPSAEAAEAQVLKTIAEKERKGYREVGASGSTPAASVPAAGSVAASPVAAASPAPEESGALPDEDTFVLPAAWQRALHPRRGGLRRAPGKVRRQELDTLERREAEETDWIQQFLDAPGSDAALVAALRAHRAGEHSPTGAAVLASVVAVPPTSGWADLWIARHGLPFAARAAVEYFLVEAHWMQAGAQRSDPWLEARTAPLTTHLYSHLGSHGPVGDRVRALIAAADEDTYRATVAALAESRTDTPRRVIASYLAPSETAWVDELCSDPEATGSRDHTIGVMLLCSLRSADQLEALTDPPGVHQSVALTATVAEGIGTAVAPLLAQGLQPSYYADTTKKAAAALAEIPTDEALRLLLDHADSKHTRAALFEAMRRCPVRALRLLAGDVRDKDEQAAKDARRWLLSHVAAHPALVSSVLPTLGDDLVAVIDPLLNPVDRVPDTDANALPTVLTSPPWTRPRATAAPVVVAGLTADHAPSVDWLPGERDAWAASSSWYTEAHSSGDWERDIAGLWQGLTGSSLQSAWVYINAPEGLVAEALAVWDPTDIYDGLDTLRPVVARFGLDALPLLLRAVPRQPGSLAPLLLPFVDVSVARHMASWTLRLKSTAATARSWFRRHGATAAAFLVPDAVGRAGAARRAAEQALVLIASLHGPDTVRKAAATYGEQAAEAVGVLLAVDPLELALPPTVPQLPGWAQPLLLPQIAARAGGALPEDSVRHALTMLAMSRPGDPYPGLTALTDVAEAGSLAEFVWALFERWREADQPAKEAWALHALGLLGDDGTVRRLTPVIRAWPGEAAHHRAVEGLEVLAEIGTDVALLHLHGIAQRVKFKGLRTRAQEKIAEVAAGLGLSGEQLSDRLVPDFGLDAGGSTVVDYGTRTFTVGFDEQLRPFVLDGEGKRRKDLPVPGAKDDAELAPAERKRFMALKKDVRTIASDQVRRFEAAMVTGRSWTAQEFRELFVGHPLLWHLVRRLVWLSETDGVRTAFRVAEDRTFADVEDDAFALPDGATVYLAHPLHLGAGLAAWSEVFADYEILQPFPQLGRAVAALGPEEADSYRLPRFEGLKVTTGKVLGLQRRGWERGVPQDAGVERWISKRLGDKAYLVIALDTGIAVGVVDMFPDQTLETVWLASAPGDHYPGRYGYPLRFSGLDPVVVSELLADLAELTEGVAA